MTLIFDFFELELVSLSLSYISEISFVILFVPCFCPPCPFDVLVVFLHCSIQLIQDISLDCIVALCLVILLKFALLKKKKHVWYSTGVEKISINCVDN